jgi:hypothetical protein
MQNGLAHLFAQTLPWWARPSHEPVCTERRVAKRSASMSCTPTTSPSTRTAPVRFHLSGVHSARWRHHHWADSRSRSGEGRSVNGVVKGMVAGS